MSKQIYKNEKGFATHVLSSEVGIACVECGNLFSKTDVLYIMNTSNGGIVQCSSKLCFEVQGGIIDEYQVNTIISRKNIVIPNSTKSDSIVQSIIPQSTGLKGKVIDVNHYLHEIENTLLEEEQNQEFSTNGSKLGMYIKMVEEIIYRDVQEGV